MEVLPSWLGLTGEELSYTNKEMEMGPSIPLASRALASAAPGMLQRVATRIGAAANPSAILAAMKNNPVTTVLVGAELFGPTSDFVKTVVRENPEIAQLVDRISDIDYQADAFEPIDDAKTGLTRYKDEFDLIEYCSRVLGGRDNLTRLRNVLKIEDSVFHLHEQVVQMGYRR